MTSLIAIKSKSEKEGLILFATIEMIMIEAEVRDMVKLLLWSMALRILF